MSDCVDWYDDPWFDTFEEIVDGKVLRGNEWRRYMYFKEKQNHKLETLSVAGVSLRIPALIKAIEKGAKRVAFVPEPTNKHDAQAIRIEIEGQHVGYVPKAKRLKKADTKGHVLKCSADPPQVLLAIA